MVRLNWLFLLGLLAGCGGDPASTNHTMPPPEPTSDLTFVEPTPVVGGVQLRLKPAADASVSSTLIGNIDVWQVEGKNSIPPEAVGKSTMSMDYTVTVSSVEAGKVLLAFDSSPLKLTGKAQGEWQQLGGQKGEVRFDDRGALLEDPSSLFEGLFGAGMVMYPESPIGPGSTWSSSNTRDMPPFGPVKVDEKFVYRGKEDVNGVSVHRIDSTATGSLEGMTMTATYYVRDDGLPFAATIKTKASAPIAVQDDGTQVWAGFTVDVEIKPKKG
ncbi:MAG: hypothetical protein ABIV13_06045 [Fimbriimonadales bacterium]